MLQTYQAELNGSQLIWLDKPPATLARERVVVVMERPAQHDAVEPAPNLTQAFVQARGCLGTARRDDVLQQLEQLRSDWERHSIVLPGSRSTDSGLADGS
jgi:hypothetical protein